MRLHLPQTVAMAGLVVSQSGLAVAVSHGDSESFDSSKNAPESSPTQAAPPAGTTSLMTFTFDGDPLELVKYGTGVMYLINFDAAKDDYEQGTFTWTIDSSVENVNVTAVGLCKLGTSGSCELAYSKDYPAIFREPEETDLLVVVDQNLNGAVPGGTPLWSRSGKIALHAESEASESVYMKDLHNSALFIQVNWLNINNNEASGISYTPFFAIYTNGAGERERAEDVLKNATDLTGRTQIAERNNLPFQSVTAISPPGATSTDDGSSTTVSGNTGGVGDTGSDSSSGNGKDSGSGPALSMGAIIGIAVGCGVAVIIAAAVLLWLCIRRKRRNNVAHHISKTEGMDHVHDGYDTTPANHEFMADKETHPRITESPHPPYSDNIGLGVTTGTAAAANSNDRSYTPYGDPPTPIQQHASLRHSTHAPSPVQSVGPTSAPVAPGHDVGAPRVGSTTPHGLSRSFAALVEEGMTDDEIRRLEEEERALDAAIEQAERNR